jgi:hypothetical protein
MALSRPRTPTAWYDALIGADVSEARSSEERPIRLGVSSCLLGNEVRFDGGHKRDRFVTGLLGRFVEWVPVCPEVEVGMAKPRPALRLVGDGVLEPHPRELMLRNHVRGSPREQSSFSSARCVILGWDL